MSSDLWNRRYRDEGCIWGTKCSPTCTAALRHLPTSGSILDIGYGYGRDILHLRRLGYEVAGAERSIEALLQTDRALEEEGFDASLGLGLGNNILEVIDLPAFDGVISHRTLHLLDEQELSKFVTACVRMKEKSILAVSARDIRDYDPGQMRLLDEGTAEYTLPDRRGHRISFWTADRFRSTLGPYFDLIELIQGEETEAAGNVLKNAHFTIMIGRRNHCCPDASG